MGPAARTPPWLAFLAFPPPGRIHPSAASWLDPLSFPWPSRSPVDLTVPCGALGSCSFSSTSELPHFLIYPASFTPLTLLRAAASHLLPCVVSCHQKSSKVPIFWWPPAAGNISVPPFLSAKPVSWRLSVVYIHCSNTRVPNTYRCFLCKVQVSFFFFIYIYIFNYYYFLIFFQKNCHWVL